MAFPTERVEARARFDEFVEDEHERLYKALYFVTGSREDAEDISQEAFLALWERWDRIDAIDDPTGYLFRVALNGFRMRRRKAAIAVRRVAPSRAEHDAFADAEMRADVRALLLGLSPRQRAALPARGPARVSVRAGGAHPARPAVDRCTGVPYGPGESFIDLGQGHVHSARNEGSTVVSLYVMYPDVPPGVTSPFIGAENPGNCSF